MANIKLVALDVFGTIAGGNAHPGPYAHISRNLGVDGRKLSRAAQTTNLGVGPLIDLLAASQPVELRRATEKLVLQDLEKDLAQIYLFPETVAVLAALQGRGIQTALVSNLAQPYAAPIISLLSQHGVLPEVCIWSFEVGAMKPQIEIYAKLFERTGCKPQETLFIGDKANRDLWPPRELGCEARLIVRDSQRVIEGVKGEEKVESLMDVFGVIGLRLATQMRAIDLDTQKFELRISP